MEGLLKDMGFKTSTTINYESHHAISIRRRVNNNKPFEHQKFEGLSESANWSDYPLLTRHEEEIKQGSTSLVKYVSDTLSDPLAIVLLPPKLYLVFFYQVSLVNQTGLTCSDFRRPLEVLLGSSCCTISHIHTP